MPGREALVHEQRLDPAVVLVQQRAEAVPAHQVLDRVEPEVGQLGDRLADGRAVAAGRPRDGAERRAVGLERRGGDEQLAEGAGVDVAQLAALGEGDDDVGVLGLGVLGATSPAAAGRSCRGARPACPRCRASSSRYLPSRPTDLMVWPSSRARKCLAEGCRRTERPLATDTALILRPTTSRARSWRRVSTSGSSGTGQLLPGRPGGLLLGVLLGAPLAGPPAASRPRYTSAT